MAGPENQPAQTTANYAAIAPTAERIVEVAEPIRAFAPVSYDECSRPLGSEKSNTEFCRNTSLTAVTGADGNTYFAPRWCEWIDSGRCRVLAGALAFRYVGDEKYDIADPAAASDPASVYDYQDAIGPVVPPEMLPPTAPSLLDETTELGPYL